MEQCDLVPAVGSISPIAEPMCDQIDSGANDLHRHRDMSVEPACIFKGTCL
jgi:hypothetical protein